jgi:hypothetical protein
MTSLLSRITLGLAITAIPLFAVGCGSTSNPTPPAPQNGSVAMTMSDASTADWATIGVKVTAISLTPAVGTTAVTAYTAPSPAPIVNLVQLDQLSELLGNATVPAGTYSGATLTISANPGDVLLTAAADPTPGFEGPAGAAVPSNQIQIMGATGAAGSLTVPVSVTFVTPLVVTATNTNALDLEFNLAHPAFLVPHVPQAGAILWAINFNGPVRHHPVRNIAALVLRHIYGTATAVSTDNTSITMTKDFALEPPASPETAIASTQDLTILADDTNGTILYDVDAQTVATIMDFSTIATTLDGKFVRVAARYQADGTLVAVRLWVSTLFNSVWLSPEGHVLHVDAIGDTLTVENELGVGVPITVNTSTEYYFRTPANAVADATAIGTGTAFLSNLVRGFKVHASAVDPLASPLVAQEIDIEIARYDGKISAADGTGFLDTATFNTASDDYSLTLPYISGSTANGTDPLSGTAITGFKWWNLTYPTQVNSGAAAIASFEAATVGSTVVNGQVGTILAAGASFATWNDPIAPDDWSVPFTILLPEPLPLGTVVTGYAAGTFTMVLDGGAANVLTDVSTTAGSATLVYRIDRTANVVTVTPVDITTTSGLATFTAGLVTGSRVRVFGVPQADGSIKAYAVFFYTGTLPAIPV